MRVTESIKVSDNVWHGMCDFNLLQLFAADGNTLDRPVEV
jgi:hypothetical protein